MTSTGDVETRAVIKFCVGLGKTPTQTLKLIGEGMKRKCSRSLVFKWHKRFDQGREDLHDDARCGRTAQVKPSICEQVRTMILEDRRLTVRALAGRLSVSPSVVFSVLTQDLKMSKVSARWVPRLLSEHDKERRVACSQEFLRRYQNEGDTFLDRIITLDETWVWHYDPESKAQSSVWKTPQTPPPRKARVMKSGGKHMFLFVADRKGMLLQRQIPDGQTVNANYYSKVLRRDIARALRRKRPDVPLDNIILHQDNAPSHTAYSTMMEISLLGFELLPHPPYSPDLAPMDFRVFPELKARLRGSRFQTVNELKSEVQRIVSSFEQSWYVDTFDKWINRHEKCVRVSGDYIEKM